MECDLAYHGIPVLKDSHLGIILPSRHLLHQITYASGIGGHPSAVGHISCITQVRALNNFVPAPVTKLSRLRCRYSACINFIERLRDATDCDIQLPIYGNLANRRKFDSWPVQWRAQQRPSTVSPTHLLSADVLGAQSRKVLSRIQ